MTSSRSVPPLQRTTRPLLSPRNRLPPSRVCVLLLPALWEASCASRRFSVASPGTASRGSAVMAPGLSSRPSSVAAAAAATSCGSFSLAAGIVAPRTGYSHCGMGRSGCPHHVRLPPRRAVAARPVVSGPNLAASTAAPKPCDIRRDREDCAPCPLGSHFAALAGRASMAATLAPSLSSSDGGALPARRSMCPACRSNVPLRRPPLLACFALPSTAHSV